MVHSSPPPTRKVIGIVAGEPSGDRLGAALIRYYKANNVPIRFVGIGGPAMEEAGCEILYAMDPLCSVGIVDVMKKLPTLYRLFFNTVKQLVSLPIDGFIGIDNPDFNLRMAKAIKKRLNVPVVQYGSPTIWAWRKRRLNTMNRYVDRVFTLFPFEVDCYKGAKVKAHFVGHPLAHHLSLGDIHHSNPSPLNLPSQGPIIALLPGSRASEINYLTPPFLEVLEICAKKYPSLHCVVPMVNESLQAQFLALKNKLAPHLPCTVLLGQALEAIRAGEVVLLASGTATLETLLLGKPMVVGYKVPWINDLLKRLLVNVPYIAFPNLLAGKKLVPEYYQGALQPAVLADSLCELLGNKEKVHHLKKDFLLLHEKMRMDTHDHIHKVLTEIGMI